MQNGRPGSLEAGAQPRSRRAAPPRPAWVGPERRNRPAPERSEGAGLHDAPVTPPALLAWFSAHRSESLVAVFAPVGHGKTTLLGQALAADVRPLLWFSLEDGDNDPAVLMTHLAELGTAFESIERPTVVVLDDVHVLRDLECLDVVAALCAHVPEGSQLVLAGRREPQVGLAHPRAERRFAQLVQRIEGWPAGLCLIAPPMHERGLLDPAGLGPKAVAERLRSEVLTRMQDEEREFLTRTAVLERMCGPLCDAVLERPGGPTMLDSLTRSNDFVVSLDNAGGWYRYHRLFREVLVRELEHQEPGAAPILRRRAAAWCEDHGEPEKAIEYAFAGGDLEHVARLLTDYAMELYQNGRLETLCGWIDRLDQPGLLEGHPEIAVLGAWTKGLSGHPAAAERWAEVAKGGFSAGPLADGGATIEHWEATLSASMCRDGADRMGADAERVLDLADKRSPWRSRGSLLLALSLVVRGDDDRADAVFADTVEVAEALRMNDDRSTALAERSLLASARGDVCGAYRFAEEARRVVLDAGLDEYVTSAITYAALGKVALHWRDRARARVEFDRVDRLRPLLTWFMPVRSVQARLELVRERLVCADPVGARAVLREVDQLLRRTPGLGVLAVQAGELREQVDSMRLSSGDAAPLLTEAELRVLPLLSTYLSVAEIADRQFVSRATVKTQAISIYRKLDVTSRSEAVERAAELGLIDSAAVPPRRDFDLSS